MHRETASRIMRDRGREPWEIRILSAFLEESGVLPALSEEADHQDLDEAARTVLAHGQLRPTKLKELLDSARSKRLAGQQSHRVSLIESLAEGQDEFTREEIEERVEQLAIVESQIARVGVPQNLVVPIAGFLQAADCTILDTDSPGQIGTAIHHAAKLLLQAVPL